jgi:DNA mismatch repair protein MutL
MPRIRILDQGTVSKIAAGEVIERPSSVAKELIENSIDAGAKKVLIEVIEGGRSLIKVTDDGCGMEPEDLSVAFHKHATSKISGADDLFNVKTMGFRGEALFSIVNVARSIDVFTKIKGALAGTFMRLENGRIVETKETGCPKGTTIIVKDLFYNLPARRKHLKSPETELAFITHLVTEMAIINHEVSFELFSGDRTFFKSIRSKTWDDVLLRIFGINVVRKFFNFHAESDQWIIRGVASDPLTTRSGPDRIYIYINGRAVNSRSLASALRDPYRSKIPAGRYPVAVISIEIDPELVDVNIHPTKREVRLLKEDEISIAVNHAVASAMRDKSKALVDLPIHKAQIPDNIHAEVASSSQQQPLLSNFSKHEMDSNPENEKSFEVDILGQIYDLYILAKCTEGFMLVDQHAAAERIRFEQLLEKYRTKTISQNLVEPIILELDPDEQILLDKWQEELKDIGFDIIPFGGKTCYIRAVPAIGRKLESPTVIHDILRELLASGKIIRDSTNKEGMLKFLSCRESIKSGQKMTAAEMKHLLKDLFSCQNPLTCPHGRPIAIILKPEQLERLFHRR